MNKTNSTSNSRLSSSKKEFIFNLNVLSKYQEDLIDTPNFVVIYDYNIITSKIFLEFKKKILAKLFKNLKVETLIPIPIQQNINLKRVKINEFISSDCSNLFKFDIKEVFKKLEELIKISKSRYFDILVVSGGNYEKLEESYMNEIIAKISKKIDIKIKIIKLFSDKNNNESEFDYFLKLNTNKDDNNKIIELTEKFSEENIYKELYDYFEYKNLMSGWKIVRYGNKILKEPINYARNIENINEEKFFENFNECISSLSQRVAINKTISNQFSLKQNESIILFCKDMLNLSKNKKIKNSYECIIRGLEKINNDNQISKLDNHKLSNYINKSSEKIKEETLKNKNKKEKYNNKNIPLVNNNNIFLIKQKDKIIIDAKKSDRKKLENCINNTNKLQPKYKNLFNGTVSSNLYNKVKKEKKEEEKIAIRYSGKSNINKNENTPSKIENKNLNNEKNENLIKSNLLSKDEVNKLKNNLSKSVKPLNNTIIAVIDASKYMKEYINDLINDLLYNLFKRLNYEDKEKIYLLGYNSEDVEEMFLPISKLSKLKIETEGERDISEVCNKIYDILKHNRGKSFTILFFTSGKINKENLSFSQSKLFLYEDENQKIKMQVIKYIVNEKSDFDKDDENIFDMLNSINSKDKNKSLIINKNNSISENINKLIKNLI